MTNADDFDDNANLTAALIGLPNPTAKATSIDELTAKRAAAAMKRLATEQRRAPFKALEKFCAVIETMPERQRAAMIRWLASRYEVTW